MAFIDAMTRAAKAVLAEINETYRAEGFNGQADLTGNVFMDIGNEAVWFELEDSVSHTTTWATKDYPEFAAEGETVVVATDTDHRKDFARPKADTYSVMSNEIDDEIHTEETLYTGLSKAEATATARACYDMGEPEKYNYYVRKENPYTR